MILYYVMPPLFVFGFGLSYSRRDRSSSTPSFDCFLHLSHMLNLIAGHVDSALPTESYYKSFYLL